MSGATRLPFVAGSVTVAAAIAALMNIPAVRHVLDGLLGPALSRNMWKIAAVGWAVLNFKNLPGMWHFRVLRGIIYQIYFQPTTQQPRHLFAPMITSSYNTPYDTDYNLHKSNSTYFADLDVARAHYVGALIRTGLARLNRGDEDGLPASAKQATGQYFVALGAVSCFFQREIAPLQAFDVFTRILSWDRKWVYIVSHIVKKGVVKPERYVLQPWKKSSRRPGQQQQQQQSDDELAKHIFATSISRYVFKKGRLTINPEIVLERSRLLPPRPDGVGYPPRADSERDSERDSASASASSSWTPAGTEPVTAPPNADQVAAKLRQAAGVASEADSSNDSDEWTWEEMERERVRGLEIAGHFDKLNAAHGELKGDVVLGRYGEYW